EDLPRHPARERPGAARRDGGRRGGQEGRRGERRSPQLLGRRESGGPGRRPRLWVRRRRALRRGRLYGHAVGRGVRRARLVAPHPRGGWWLRRRAAARRAAARGVYYAADWWVGGSGDGGGRAAARPPSPWNVRSPAPDGASTEAQR